MSNFFKSTLVAVGFTFIAVIATTTNTKLNNIESNIERVKVESIVSSGKAIYMPGSVCVLKATSDITTLKMREFAAACIRSHDKWLLIDKQEATYKHEDKTLPKK
jgi:hypothetical protein